MLTQERQSAQAPIFTPGPNPTGAAPIVRALPADLETPVSVYLRLAGSEPSFLLESVTGGEQVARYSFIGVQPRAAYVFRGRAVTCHTAGGVMEDTLPPDRDLLDALRDALAENRPPPCPACHAWSVAWWATWATRACAFSSRCCAWSRHLMCPTPCFCWPIPS